MAADARRKSVGSTAPRRIYGVTESRVSETGEFTPDGRISTIREDSNFESHMMEGGVVTEAGTEPSVAGLVYIAAHNPDAGENEADDGKRFPE